MNFPQSEDTTIHQYDDSTIRVVLQDMIKADLLIKALIQDIRKCPGPIDVLNSLNASISENMRKMKSALDELETLAREQDIETEKHKLLKEAEKQQKQYSANQFALRKANLACQALLDRQTKEELFEVAGVKRRKSARADKDSISKQSAHITDRLSALTGSLASQVAQSEESLRTLASSSAAVQDTQEELKSMGGILMQSKTLLQKYGRREITDRVLVAIATLFFLACVLYITHKRLF